MKCYIRALSAAFLTLIPHALSGAMQSSSSCSSSAISSQPTHAIAIQPITQQQVITDNSCDNKEEKKAATRTQTPPIKAATPKKNIPALSEHFSDLTSPYPVFDSQQEFADFCDTLKNETICGDLYANFRRTLDTFNNIMMQELGPSTRWVEEKGCIQQTFQSFTPFAQCLPLDKTKKYSFIPISDLHGDGQALIALLEDLIKKDKLSADYKILDPNLYLIFLGDYSDRNPFGVEVWSIIMRLKITNPNNVYIQRGNHEALSQNRTLFNALGFMNEVRNKMDDITTDDIVNLYNHLPLALYVTNGQQTAVFCHAFPDPCFDPLALLTASTAAKKPMNMRLNEKNYDKAKFFASLTESQRATIADAITQTHRRAQCQEGINTLAQCVIDYLTLSKIIAKNIDEENVAYAQINKLREQQQAILTTFQPIIQEMPIELINTKTSIDELNEFLAPREHLLHDIAELTTDIVAALSGAEHKDEKTTAPTNNSITTTNTAVSPYHERLQQIAALQAAYTAKKDYLCTIMKDDVKKLNLLMPALLCNPNKYRELNANLRLEETYPMLFAKDMFTDSTLCNLRSAIPTSIDDSPFVWLDYDMDDYCRKTPMPNHNNCISFDHTSYRTTLGRELVQYIFAHRYVDYIIRGHQHGAEDARAILTQANSIHVSSKKNKDTGYDLTHGDICTVVTGRGPWITPRLATYTYCIITMQGNTTSLQKVTVSDD